MDNELIHHGILGMKWGVRRTPEQLGHREAKRAEKKDTKWADKNYKKIYSQTYKKAAGEMNQYVNTELRSKYADQLSSGKVSRSLMNDYNRKLATLMNQNVGDITAPSGRVVQWVAKRGEVGVHMALADRGYDISQLKNGVFSSGKIAYKKKKVDMA